MEGSAEGETGQAVWPGRQRCGGVLAKLRYVVRVKDAPGFPYQAGWSVEEN